MLTVQLINSSWWSSGCYHSCSPSNDHSKFDGFAHMKPVAGDDLLEEITVSQLPTTWILPTFTPSMHIPTPLKFNIDTPNSHNFRGTTFYKPSFCVSMLNVQGVSIYLSIHLSIHPSIHPSIYLSLILVPITPPLHLLLCIFNSATRRWFTSNLPWMTIETSLG